jgi:hypothetical protein
MIPDVTSQGFSTRDSFEPHQGHLAMSGDTFVVTTAGRGAYWDLVGKGHSYPFYKAQDSPLSKGLANSKCKERETVLSVL